MLVPTRLAQLQQTPRLPQILELSKIPKLSEISGLLPQITRLFPNLELGKFWGQMGSVCHLL